MKKVGWTIVSLLPILLYFGIQVGCSFGASLVITIIVSAQNAGKGLSAGEITILATQKVMENIVLILIVSQLVATLGFGLWYYLAYGKKKRPEGTEKPVPVHFLLIVVMGILAQFFISSILNLVQSYAPQLLEQYNELMEQMGILEGTALTLFSTVVLAPLSEELACRGVILKLAGKVSPKFWFANVIQALAFGILHANLVQGIYAFGLGLLLGALYGKFKNIWLCMLLHAVMNASSMLVGPVYMLLAPDSGNPTVAALAAVLALSAVLLALCASALLGRRNRTTSQ